MIMIYHIAKRFGTEMYRLRISSLIMIAMPAFMGFMFFFAFNSAGLGEAHTYHIAVINDDTGIADDLSDYLKLAKSLGFDIGIDDNILDDGFAVDFIDILNTTYYPTDDGSSETRIFSVTEIENVSIGKKMVESRTIDGLVIFSRNYSNATLSAINQASKIETGFFIDEPGYYSGPSFPRVDNASIQTIGDENFANFLVVKAVLNSFVTAFEESLHSFNYQGGNLNIAITSIIVTEYTIFDTIMPGILIFAILTQAGMLAAFLVSEFAETKTIMRIKLSLIKPYEYVLGVSAIMIVITFLQVIILLGFSMLVLGFNPEGDIIQGIIVVMLTSIFVTALGFLLAGIFKSSDTAGQSSGFLMTPIAFMAGGFMDVPPITLIESIIPTPSGYTRNLLLWDFMPVTHSVNALKSILLYNFTLMDVIVDLMMLVIPSTCFLIFSILFYTNRRFKGDIL